MKVYAKKFAEFEDQSLKKGTTSHLIWIRWEKNITLGEPPGFLHSWWCVFWDLYCAAPERRDTCEHSSEAKAFHDYGFVNSGYSVNGIAHNPTAPSPLGQMPPSEGMPGGPMPPAGFFPNSHMRPSPPQQPVSQPSPHPQPPPPHNQMMQSQPFMSPRYPGGPRPGVRMPQQVDFNPPGSVPGQPMMPNSLDPTRQGDGGEFVGWQVSKIFNSSGLKFAIGPPGMAMNPRMNPPRGQPLGPMNPANYGGMRPPHNSTLGPGGPTMPPMSMPGPGGRPWQPNTTQISYSSASPGSHYGGPPVSGTGPPGPGTPIMPSPQGSTGPYSPASHRMNAPTPRRDSGGSGADGMYTMMKPVPGGSLSGFPMGPGPDGPMGPMGPEMGPPVMNGMSSGDGLDGMKSSPANGPGTPREDGPPMGDYGIPTYGQENMSGGGGGIDMQCHLQACTSHQSAPL
ncbi:single-stranded DNA-binding protein 3-like isoform X1 [Centruroides vittatus]|uniref:single-stranded DNA-binding protein 3-like isoform X1 n=1 Tax=Centruroides vittatus TaxID=120091 RepID=UPI00350F1489